MMLFYFCLLSGYLHHIQWSVASRAQVVAQLTETWGGQAVCERELETVVRLGSTLFLVSEKQQEVRRSSSSASCYPFLQCCHGSVCHHTQAVFNICLEVGDVPGTVERMERQAELSTGGLSVRIMMFLCHKDTA